MNCLVERCGACLTLGYQSVSRVCICDDPGSAVHHHSARKTRVNALMVLHRDRDTIYFGGAVSPRIVHAASSGQRTANAS
jgi:hypothetical protein